MEEEEEKSPKGVPQARTPRHIRRGGSTGSPRLGVPQTRDPQAEEEEANCPKGVPKAKTEGVLLVLLTAEGGAHPTPRHIWRRRLQGPPKKIHNYLRYVKHCFACLDIILSLSGALLCFRASGAKQMRRIFLDRSHFVDIKRTIIDMLLIFGRKLGLEMSI